MTKNRILERFCPKFHFRWEAAKGPLRRPRLAKLPPALGSLRPELPRCGLRKLIGAVSLGFNICGISWSRVLAEFAVKCVNCLSGSDSGDLGIWRGCWGTTGSNETFRNQHFTCSRRLAYSEKHLSAECSLYDRYFEIIALVQAYCALLLCVT